jgi:mono/diheme cytochrome c family protein
MLNFRSGFSFCLAIGIAMPAVAIAQERGDRERGRTHAENVCAVCHAIDPGEIHSPVAGLAGFEEIANTRGMTALALKVWFQSPHPSMPNFILAPEEIDNLVAYILSLKEKR